MPESAAILLSRQALRPCARTAWVRRAREAVELLKEKRITLLSSTGMTTWELLTAQASLYKIPVNIYLVCSPNEDFSRRRALCIEEFDLDGNDTEFTPILINDIKLSKEDKMSLRDRRIIDAADILMPLSINPDGNMARLLEQYGDKEILRDFEIKYEKRQNTLAYEIDPMRLSTEIVSAGDKYLFHWTRTFNTAWPGERLIDFYRAVLINPVYPRGAFETLMRILTMKKIMASGRHMPGDVKTVSFSASSPVELLPLMTWRARYRQMSFEPYGLGVRKETALAHGVQPVRYYEKKRLVDIEKNDRWLYQSAGLISDWRREKEYRFRGDFIFDYIKPNDIIAVCRTKNEARALENTAGFNTISFTE
ncbi:MAG: hypothetical protein JXA92_05675 [candidate division Zixibacteria bacterium]|nr:hypothetical protein [candidate division Zixibacteria bacterium]